MTAQEFCTRLLRNRRTPIPFSGPIYACLGNFDGIHLGHQKLIERVKERAGHDASGRTMMISFYPHPSLVLGHAQALPSLVSLRQRLRILSENGVDYLYLVHFTRPLSSCRAAEFIDRILFKTLKVTFLAVGPDASVGYRREGNTTFLREYFERAGRLAEVVPYLTFMDARVSSGAVREALLSGDVGRAGRLLGRPYALEGRVVRGAQRGVGLGFATANLNTRQFLPKFGVYASRTVIGGRDYLGVTNIGIRPTFHGKTPSVESHLPEWRGGDLYGERLELKLIDRIRDELRFSSVQELIAQVAKDIRVVKDLER